MKLIANFIDRSEDKLHQQVKVQPPVKSFSNKVLLSSLLLFGVLLCTTDAVFAGACKDVKITVTNNTTDTIKATKFLYVDVDKKKQHLEPLFGLNGRDVLNPGNSTVVTRDLAFVGGEKIFFKVIYAHKIGRAKFESDITQTTPQFTCANGSSHTVSLTR